MGKRCPERRGRTASLLGALGRGEIRRYDRSMSKKTACVLNGSLRGGTPADRAASATVKLLEDRGFGAVVHTLRDLDIAPCLGCFACWVKTPGVCIIDDAGRDVARSMIRSDLVAYVTPVTFGGYSSELKKAVDRKIPLILPYFTFVGNEVHHIRRYPSAPCLLGVGVLETPNVRWEEIFKTLVQRNAINFHSPDAEACFVRGDEDEDRGRIAAAIGEVTQA